MAAGDLIAANFADLSTIFGYQAELNGVLVGDGSPWGITEFDGLGDVENTPNTAARLLATGVASGLHMAATGGVVFTAIPRGLSTASEVEAKVALLEAAWSVASPSRTPLELHLLCPGRGHLKVLGWPHTMKVTRSFPAGGVVSVVCAFLRTETTVTVVRAEGA